MPVKAPADKRFRRAHVSPARQRRMWPPDWRVVLRLVAVLAIVGYGGYRGVSWAIQANALVVDKVTVSGNHNLSRGEVVALLEGIRGESMLTLDIEAWRQRLLDSPWVSDAAIRRQLPGTVSVAVLERAPIGIARLGDELYLVDREGTVIDAHGPNYADLDLPILTGLEAANSGDSRAIDHDRSTLVVEVVDALSTRRDLASRISEIDVTDAHDAAVLLKDDPTIVRLGDENFVRRLTQYIELAPTLRERVPDLDYVDVRFDERVYVRPRSAKPLVMAKPVRTTAALVPKPSPLAPMASAPAPATPAKAPAVPSPSAPSVPAAPLQAQPSGAGATHGSEKTSASVEKVEKVEKAGKAARGKRRSKASGRKRATRRALARRGQALATQQ